MRVSSTHSNGKDEKRKDQFAKLSPTLMEKQMKIYQASYEDMEKSSAEARRRGWDGESEGMLDYLNCNGISVHRNFSTKEKAETWLKTEISAHKTLYGCGDIDVLTQPKRRCKYCTCNGWITTQSFLADDTGIVEEREVSEECWDGDDE